MIDAKTLIFCPTCHRFVGEREKCRYCDWVRPTQPGRVGQTKWSGSASLDEPLPGAPPYPAQITPVGELLIMPTETGDVIAFEAQSGREVWRRTIRADRRLRTHAITPWRDTLLIGCENLTEIPTRDRSLLLWQAANGGDAWSFQTNGDSLSAPLVVDNVAYFASSEPRLYALDLVTRQLRWEAAALTWSPDAPAFFDQTLVVPSRGPQVAAYSALDGARLWTFTADDKEAEWLNYRPIVTAETAYLSGWRNRLYAVDRMTGEARWRVQVERGLTSPPVLAADRLLIGVKDYRPVEGGSSSVPSNQKLAERGNPVPSNEKSKGRAQGKPGYGLYAIDTASGDIAWRLRTDKHVHVPPIVIDQVVLVGADDRRLRALKLSDGSELWQITLPDKVRVGPIVIGDEAIVGGRDGALTCVWWKVETPARPDPRELIKQGKPLEAAAALALIGEYVEAAQLFAQQQQLSEAAALWLEADRVDEAATLYAQLGDVNTAIKLRRQINDRAGEAALLAQTGLHAEAAAIYEELNNLDRAVEEYIAADRAGYAAQLLRKAGRKREATELYHRVHQDDLAAEILIEEGRYAEAAATYLCIDKLEVAADVYMQGGLWIEAAELNEQLGRLALAAELYEKADRLDRAIEVYGQLKDWKHAADLAEKTGDWPRVAEAALQLDQPIRAADAYERGGQLTRALDLYETLKDWVHMAQLASQLNQWERQARAYREQGLITQAGEAYERAAAQLPADAPEAELARLYDAAAQCYGEDDTEVRRYEACLERVCQYRHLPNLRGRFDLMRAFYADEQNEVYFLVSNQGYGVAKALKIVEVSSKFQLASDESQMMIPRLNPQQNKTLRLMLQAKPNVHGRTLLKVMVAYLDHDSVPHTTPFEYVVEVVAHDEKLVAMHRPSTTDTKPNIIVHGGNVVVGGTQVQGDQIADGGQKGDKIEITREGRRIRLDEDALSIEPGEEVTCPQCGGKSPAGSKFCQQCQTKLQ